MTISSLLLRLDHACHIPLFEEIAHELNDIQLEQEATLAAASSRGGTAAAREGGDAAEEREASSWSSLLRQAATLAPYMTADEHAQVTQYATLYLLGYLIPTLTGGRDLYAAVSGHRRLLETQRQQQQMRGKQQRKRPRTTTDPPAAKTSSTTTTITSATAQSASISSPLLLGNIYLPLEELLEHATASYTLLNSESGYNVPGGCVVDERVSTAFHRLIHRGLGTWLASRTCHPTQTDLVHLLAMAIRPGGSTGGDNEVAAAASPSYQRARRLMGCPHAHAFVVNYPDRVELVTMISECLVVPDAETLVADQQQHKEEQGEEAESSSAAAPMEGSAEEPREGDAPAEERDGDDSPMIDGALHHLRWALEGFAAGAITVDDATAARRSLVNIAVASGHVPFLEETVDRLVGALADCRAGGVRCRVASTGTGGDRDVHCPYGAYGSLLGDLILRHNGSRHYADEAFTRRALVLVAGALKRLTATIVVETAAHEDALASATQDCAKATAGVCQLCAILDAARSLFYFILPSKLEDDTVVDAEDGVAKDDAMDITTFTFSQKEENEAYGSLLESAILMLNHPDLQVVKASSSLLALAFAYSGGDEYVSSYAKGIVTAIRCCFDQQQNESGGDEARSTGCTSRIIALRDVIVVFSRRSGSFAGTIMSNLFQKNTRANESILHLASTIAVSNPVAVAKYREHLHLAVKEKSDQERYLVAIYLSCRLAFFFSSEKRAVGIRHCILPLLDTIKDPWTLYKLSRHAFCTANFGIAEQIVSSYLLKRATSEQSHLFYLSILHSARAENIISIEGAIGIPQALPSLHTAISHLRALQSLVCTNCNIDFSFQLELVGCRVDFLNLCVAFRGLCGEMRLVNTGSFHGTRTKLHQRNIMHCFYMLAARYAALYRRHGLFHCQQTRTSLRTLSALCCFMARASSKTFYESTHGSKSRLHEFHETSGMSWPEGDASHPIGKMITKFSDSILWSMDASVEPNIRAAAMMEILDPVLKCPLPSPRGFFVSKQAPTARLRLHGSPDSIVRNDVEENEETFISDESCGAEVIEVSPGETVALHATGEFPEGLRSAATLPFSQVVVWYKIKYDGSLLPDDDVYGNDQRGNEQSVQDEFGESTDSAGGVLEAPFAAPIRPDGKFSLPIMLNPITSEGYYMVRFTLGCRDACCGEFEIATAGEISGGVIALCVTSQALGSG